ncbi:aspartyl-phosphate phosphatase Spo0E family protein [Halobacillus mangrovi]|nr:aspartyl-phosphate phosphatase Spo0E family protein [Halobacillus mangrovi]
MNAEIEVLRRRLYEAYEKGSSYEQLVHISQKLDFLLNQLNKDEAKV